MLKKLFLLAAASLIFTACNTDPEPNNATPAKASPSPATVTAPSPIATQTPAATATPSPTATASPAKPDNKPDEK